jgi:hypothetical protein
MAGEDLAGAGGSSRTAGEVFAGAGGSSRMVGEVLAGAGGSSRRACEVSAGTGERPAGHCAVVFVHKIPSGSVDTPKFLAFPMLSTRLGGIARDKATKERQVP